MWVVRFVPATDPVHETLEEILERFVDEAFLCLNRRSRGTFMNTRIVKIRHHSSLEWFHPHVCSTASCVVADLSDRKDTLLFWQACSGVSDYLFLWALAV